ncbi:hypothetical protein Q3G72_005531 [Acer saccharum]|nr:hypothetical protein Q3G72_005531 [Acer saccharum]
MPTYYYYYAVHLLVDKSLKSKLVKLHNTIAEDDDTEEYEPYIPLLVIRVPSQLHNLPTHSINFQAKFPISFKSVYFHVGNKNRNFYSLDATITWHLHRFHAKLCDVLSNVEGLQICKAYKPISWSPHCTMARLLGVLLLLRLGALFCVLHVIRLD